MGRDIIEEKNYSDETAMIIDQEVKHVIDECYVKAKKELIRHRNELKLLAETLLEKEVMDEFEVKKLLDFKDDNTDQTEDLQETKSA